MRAAGIVAAVVLLGIGPGAQAAARKAPAPRVVTIVVDKLAFGPAPRGLKVGDVVEWVNRDIFEHSATARDGSFDVDLPAGGKGRTRLKRAGAIAYVCKYHPGMTGTLDVHP